MALIVSALRMQNYDFHTVHKRIRVIFFLAEFPFDLPLPLPESNPSVNATARDGPPPVNETNVHKSLPDFLSDGPIHNRSTDPEPVASIAESGERRVNLLITRRDVNEDNR